MLIDTHAHLNFNAYKDDLDEVIKRSLNNDIWMINVGSTYETSKKAVEMAEKYPEGVYAAIGLHPIHLAEGIFRVKLDKEEVAFQTKNKHFDYQKYKELAKSEKVVAIGEIGLDYYYRPKTKIKLAAFKEKQKENFLQQLNLAKELNLPVIFHCRVAHQDLIKILTDSLSNFQNTTNYTMVENAIRGVVHCFTGDWEEAQKYLKLGLYLGFNGLIFKLDFDEIIRKTPLDKILIETDCPYLIPPQIEGRNEPLFVKYIAEKIAKIKNLTSEEMTKITTENAKKLFKI